MLIEPAPTLHIRFAGRSEELEPEALGLGPQAGDAELRAALARRYERPLAELDGYTVVREGRAIIVRPIAFYG